MLDLSTTLIWGGVGGRSVPFGSYRLILMKMNAEMHIT